MRAAARPYSGERGEGNGGSSGSMAASGLRSLGRNRRGATRQDRGPRGSAGSATGAQPAAAPAAGAESSREAAPVTQANPDKRPQRHFENDQPVIEQKRRAKEPGGDAAPSLRGKFRGRAGRTFSGAFTQTPQTTIVCSPSRPGLSSIRCSRSFRPSRRSSLCTVSSPTLRRSTRISRSHPASSPAAQSTFSTSRSRSLRQRAMESSASEFHRRARPGVLERQDAGMKAIIDALNVVYRQRRKSEAS